MPRLMLKLLPSRTRGVFNTRRWEELIMDPIVGKIKGRVETDRHGRVVLGSFSTVKHSILQTAIGFRLHDCVLTGRVSIACPISTADGVKVTDIAWASADSIKKLKIAVCFQRSPEICVEVLSSSDTRLEISEKTALYFDAGAKEVWLCSQSGSMTFHLHGASAPSKMSKICPQFPKKIELP